MDAIAGDWSMNITWNSAFTCLHSIRESGIHNRT